MMQSISNRQLTLLRKLRLKKYRQKERLFVVEGERAVEQVMANGEPEIQHLFFDEEQELWERTGWRDHSERYPSAVMDKADFLEITDTETPQGILAICAVPPEEELKKISGSEGIVMALDRIRDPGNLGTMVRTGAWFGVGGMLIGKGTVDLFHPKVVRSTAGAVGSIPYRNCDLFDALDRLEREGWQIVLMDAGPDSIPLSQFRPAGKTVVVIGNEAHGLDGELFKEGRTAARIDPDPAGKRPEMPAESLNASIALSIALYALKNSPGL